MTLRAIFRALFGPTLRERNAVLDREARMRAAMVQVLDVWTLPAVACPEGRKWHCQHEEWLAATHSVLREAIEGETPDQRLKRIAESGR